MLGVPDDVVMAEYLRSDAEIRAAFGFIVDDFVARGGDRGVIEPIVSARPAYLESAFEEVQRSYGRPARLLPGRPGARERDLEPWRAAFLEAA